MLEQALRTYLLDFEEITDEVSQRIHVGQKKFLDDSDLPAITIEGRHHADPLATHDAGLIDLQFPVLDLVVHGLLFETTVEIGDLVRRALLDLQFGGSVQLEDGSTVTIEQLEWQCDPYCDDEEHLGHGITNKPRVQTIQIGWRQSSSPL